MSQSYLRRLDTESLREAAKWLGYRKAFLLRCGEWFSRFARVSGFRYRHPIISLTIKGCAHPLHIRLGHSDALVVDQIFVQREFAALDDLWPEPKLMIDCGGNIGCASAYFLNRYPNLRVILVEPDTDNLELCRRNLSPYEDRVRIISAAVWSHPAGLVMSGTGWDTKVRESGPGERAEVYATDMPSLFRLSQDQCVDLLKIDIEWSEIAVFRAGADIWLPHVRNIAIELHDKECEETFFKALAPFKYDISVFGELTFCRNIAFDGVDRQ